MKINQNIWNTNDDESRYYISLFGIWLTINWITLRFLSIKNPHDFFTTVIVVSLSDTAAHLSG